MVILLVFLLLNGCSSMGDWLSASPSYPSPAIIYGPSLNSITIGVTTQANVRAAFGTPTDIQTSVKEGIMRETWAYAHASPSINPLQYLPLFGVLALTHVQESPTFSVSFASDGIVDGISVRDAQPYGDVRSAADRFKNGSDVTSYGNNNPMVYHVNQGILGKEGPREN